MRRQVGGTIKHLVTLGTPVLHVHYPRALVLSQLEGVGVMLFAQLADVVADLVLDLLHLRSRFGRRFHVVDAAVNVSAAYADDASSSSSSHWRLILQLNVPDERPGNRRDLAVVEADMSRSLGALRCLLDRSSSSTGGIHGFPFARMVRHLR